MKKQRFRENNHLPGTWLLAVRTVHKHPSGNNRVLSTLECMGRSTRAGGGWGLLQHRGRGCARQRALFYDTGVAGEGPKGSPSSNTDPHQNSLLDFTFSCLLIFEFPPYRQFYLLICGKFQQRSNVCSRRQHSPIVHVLESEELHDLEQAASAL